MFVMGIFVMGNLFWFIDIEVLWFWKKVLKVIIIERNFLYLNVFYKWRKFKGFVSRV